MERLSEGSLILAGVVLVVFTTLALLISRNWRVTIIALLLQYGGVFILVSSVWPTPIALIKLVAGWISTIVLALAIGNTPSEINTTPESTVKLEFRGISIHLQPISRGLFRFLGAVMVLLVVLSVATRVADWVPGIAEGLSLGAFILVGLGLLHLGLTARPFRTIVSLLTILAGFEVLYAAVEVSTLVAGLLAMMNLGLALVGTYLIYPEISEVEA